MASPRTARSPRDPDGPGGDDGRVLRLPAVGGPPAASSGKLDLRLRLSGTSPQGNAEHVVFIGAAQSGKSTSAHSVLKTLRNLVIFDPAHKGQFDHLGVVSSDPDSILRHPVVIFQPPPASVRRWAKDYSDPWSRALWNIRTVRRRSGCTVYHDEARVTLPTHPHPWAAEMVDVGPGQGIGVGASMQGPNRVYPPMLDNATHWFLFRVANASQRGSLAASLEVEGIDLGRLEPQHFYYWRQGRTGAAGPFSTSVLGGRPPRG